MSYLLLVESLINYTHDIMLGIGRMHDFGRQKTHLRFKIYIKNKCNLMQFYTNTFKYSLPPPPPPPPPPGFPMKFLVDIAIYDLGRLLELLAECRSSMILAIVYDQGLYDLYHMSVVCEKLKRKMCKLTVS